MIGRDIRRDTPALTICPSTVTSDLGHIFVAALYLECYSNDTATDLTMVIPNGSTSDTLLLARCRTWQGIESGIRQISSTSQFKFHSKHHRPDATINDPRTTTAPQNRDSAA